MDSTIDSSRYYNESLTRDALERISSLNRTIDGVSETINYSYDSSGRLIGASKTGATVEAFEYDDNDNRLLDSDTVYDAQDRLVRNRDWNFSYNARGYLASKASRTSALVVSYVYDNLDQLRTVTDNAGLGCRSRRSSNSNSNLIL